VSSLPLAINFEVLTDLDFWVAVATIAGIYAMFSLGLQINVGFTGIVNFGQAGFAALGAYAMAILVLEAGFSFWLAMPCAIVITILFGLLIGLPSLRLRADYFAIATIASAEAVRLFAQNADSLTGGNQGLRNFDDTWFEISESIESVLQSLGWSDPSSFAPLMIVVWVAVVLAMVGLTYITKSPWGRVLRAIREDEDAASALGKNALSYKLQSLSVAATLGAISGFFLALYFAFLNPQEFRPLITFLGYGVLILGGLASYYGIALGAIIIWTLLEGTRFIDLPLSEAQIAALRFIIVGVGLILLMAFRPQGMLGKKEEMVLGD